MKKIRRVKTKKNDKNFFDTRTIVVGIIAILVVMLTAVLMVLESTDGKIVIKNNTELKLDYVKTYFVDAEGPMNDGMKIENLEPGNSTSSPITNINLAGTESNFEVRFKFENYDEIFVDAGYFNEDFKGNLAVSFEKTEDSNVIKVHVKASTGLLKSNLSYCNETSIVHLSEGFVEE